MSQLLLFPTWADDMNYYTSCDETFCLSDDLAEFQAYWLELRSSEDAKKFVSRANAYYSVTRRKDEDWHLSIRQSGRFVCKRRLPSGPVRKLSELDQLSVGQSLLWSPEANAADLKFAKARTAHLRVKGRGKFHWELREDASLWLTRTSPASSCATSKLTFEEQL